MSPVPRLTLLLFRYLMLVLLPLILLRLWWRGRRQPAYRLHWRERLGMDFPAQLRAREAPIWIHAVSVGETRACVPLVQALREQAPGRPLLLTHMTPTGRAVGAELFGEQVTQCYLPYDTPFAVGRFLRHYQPCLGLLMETEVWPGLVDDCRRATMPLWLINARLSERSARGYRRLALLARPAFAALRGVLAQTDDDASRLRALGADPVIVTGNLKFDAPPAADEAGRAAQLQDWLGNARAVWLAASTREGEEMLLLDAWLAQINASADAAAVQARALRSARLILVPRHPQRFDEVAALLTARGVPFARRSQADLTQPLDPAIQVVLGDTMGELGPWYRCAAVACIGGSLLPHGGQNLLEGCARACPVLLGPHTWNFAEAAAQAVAAGAAECCNDVHALLQRVAVLLADDAQRQAMAQQGLLFIQRHQGATARTLLALQQHGSCLVPERRAHSC